MSQLLRQCSKLVLATATRPTIAVGKGFNPIAMARPLAPLPSMPILTRNYAKPAHKEAHKKGHHKKGHKEAKKGHQKDAHKKGHHKKECKKRPEVGCACARHPWPEEDEDCHSEEEVRHHCDFNFKKLEVNPFDPPCDCQDPPPAAGCRDVGRPKEVCCRSIRQYGCFCEEEESSCEELSEEEVVVKKTCDLDFKKLEVNPYDDPCECHDPPPAARCADIPRKDVCCRTPKPFTCHCEAYDEPGLECFKQKAKAKPKKKKECKKGEWKGKCL